MHKFKQNVSRKGQAGLSLVELIVALGLGIVVLVGAGQSMIQMSRSTRAQTEKNTMDQTANIAFSFISQKVRATVSTPCEQIRTIRTNDKLTRDVGNIENASTVLNLIDNQGINIVQGRTVNVGGQTVASDEVQMLSTGLAYKITGSTGIENPTVVIDESGVTEDDSGVFILSDCTAMDIFFASVSDAAGQTTLSPTNDLNVNYSDLDGTMAAQVTTSQIYVREAADEAVGGRLFERSIDSAHQSENSLLDNVDAMRVVLGVDTNNDGSVDKVITPVQMSTLTQDQTIVSLEMYLLVSADGQRENPDVEGAYTIELPDTATAADESTGVVQMETLTFSDKVIRRVFVRSITLRNIARI